MGLALKSRESPGLLDARKGERELPGGNSERWGFKEVN